MFEIFLEKIRLDISCEFSALLSINMKCLSLFNMKCQVCFSLKNNKIDFRMLPATNLLSALKVNYAFFLNLDCIGYIRSFYTVGRFCSMNY